MNQSFDFFSSENFKRFRFKIWLGQNWKMVLVLAGLVIVAYANALNNTFISDDVAAIAQNPDIGTFKFITDQSTLLYTIAYKIGGLNPIFFRMFNVFFHLGAVLTLYFLLSLMTNRLLAFYTAALFAVHPILTESVAWISGAGYGRYGFYTLLSLLFYFLRVKGNRYLILSLVFFFLALFSSNFAIAYPLILLLYEGAKGLHKRALKSLIPYAILAVLYFFFVLIGVITQRASLLNHVGQNASSLAIYQYNLLLQIPITITKYLQLIIWPNLLTLYHSEVVSYPELAIRSLVTVLFLVSLAFLYKKNRLIFFWLSFFLICISPALLPLGIASTVAERYVYLGSIGVMFTISYGLYLITRHKKYTYVSFVLFGILLVGLTTRTIIRNSDWKTFESFWTTTVKTSPLSYQARNNVGNIYLRNGDFENAVLEYEKALQLVPENPQVYQNVALAYYQTGNFDKSIVMYKKAILYDPNSPLPYQNIASVYFAQGNLDLAKQNTETALSLAGPNASLHINLGLIYVKMNDTINAKDAFQKALQIDPGNQQAQSELSKLQ